MRIAIIGASRGIGAELVKQARGSGHHVVAVSQSTQSEAAGNLTPIKGSIMDPGIADRATSGVDAVAWCVGAKTLGPALLRSVTIFSEGTRTTIEAMKRNRVTRLVAITGIGAGESRGHGGLLYDWLGLPVVVGAIYADKDRQEGMMKASGLDWTIIRPTLLTNGPRTSKYRVITDLTGFHGGRISRADCAECMLRALTERAWMRKAVVVTT